MGTKRIVQPYGGEDYNPSFRGANAGAGQYSDAANVNIGGHFNISRAFHSSIITPIDGTGGFWQNLWTPPSGVSVHIHTIWVNPTFAWTDQGSASTCGDIAIYISAMRYSDGNTIYDFCGCQILHTDYVAGSGGMYVNFGPSRTSGSVNGSGTRGLTGSTFSSNTLSGSNTTGWVSTWPCQSIVSSSVIADTIGVTFSAFGGPAFDYDTYENYGQFTFNVHMSGTIGQ